MLVLKIALKIISLQQKICEKVSPATKKLPQLHTLLGVCFVISTMFIMVRIKYNTSKAFIAS